MFSYAFRSIAAVLTALSLILSANLGSSKTGNVTLASATSGTPSQLDGTIAVHLLQSDPDRSYALQQATELYVEETGANAVFYVQTVSGRNDYRAALRSKLLSDERVDLFHLLDSSDAMRLGDALLADLSGLAWAMDTHCGVLQTVGSTHIYGIPYALEGIGLIANRSIFSAAGISLENLSSYDALDEALTDLQAAIDAGDLTEAFPNLAAATDLAGQDIDYLGTRVAELLLAGSFSAPHYAGAAPTLGLPHAEPAEAFLKRMAAASPHRGDWSAFAQVTERKLIEDGLAAQRIAVILESTSVYPRLRKANPELAQQWALLPVYFEDSETGNIFVGSPAWWGINATSDAQVQQQATAFLQWLYTSETGGMLLEEHFGILSPYPATATTQAALYRQLLAHIAANTTVPQLALEAPSGWSDQVAAPQLREYLTVREKTWAEVVAACKEGWHARR